MKRKNRAATYIVLALLLVLAVIGNVARRGPQSDPASLTTTTITSTTIMQPKQSVGARYGSGGRVWDHPENDF